MEENKPQHPPVLAHVFQLGKSDIYGMIFFKDGKEVPCHKQAPLIAASKIQGGENQMFRLPCCSTCAKANVFKKEDGSLLYQVLCEGTANNYPITPNPEEKEKPVIQMSAV